MPTTPITIAQVLRKLVDVLRTNYFLPPDTQPQPPGEILNIKNEDGYWSVLPSYWFWLPSASRHAGLEEAFIQVRDSLTLFPRVGVVGTSRWEDFALGGVMMQLIAFRVYVIAATPPALDIVERINNTISLFSMIILNNHDIPPYWWFSTITEMEPAIRSPLFPNWTIGYITGELRGTPQVLPILAPYLPATPP